MSRSAHMLLSFAAVVLGVFITLGSEWTISTAISNGGEPWVYQLIIGAALIGFGIYTWYLSDERPLLISRWAYALIGGVTGIVGLFVFTNIDRYAEILSEWGHGVLYVLGGLLVLNGILLLTHHFTEFVKEKMSDRMLREELHRREVAKLATE